MKKLVIMFCAACILSNANAFVSAAENDGVKRVPPTKEEMIQKRKAREAAFEQKLGLTDAQKAQAKELRIQGHQKIKPIMEQIKAKHDEIKVIKNSRIATEMQEEKIAVIKKDLKALEKQAKEIRKQNMKDFESILTKEQKKILKQMMEEGRKKYKQNHPHGGHPQRHSA